MMHLLVVKRANATSLYVKREFGVQKFVTDTCCLRILVYTSLCCLVKHFAIGICRSRANIIAKSGFSYLQAPFMLLVCNSKDINQTRFE
ncbi:hypothetical protein IX332_001431 [Porphyromonas levii]|nr:hypothetical protein [Porphyromonas levii]MBR8764196.1 hypothetical protein [Porphyromonas levii]